MGPLTGRRSAWIVIALFVVIVGSLAGALRGGGPVGGMDTIPATSESAREAARSATFPGAGTGQAIVVVERRDAGRLTSSDLAALGRVAKDLGAGGSASGASAFGPQPSKDGRAAVIGVPVRTDVDKTSLRHEIDTLRSRAHAAVPPTTTAQVTGGPAFGVDVAKAFDGTDVTLLLVTIGVVAVLLLLTYRSPILWLLPLSVVALADQASNVVTGALGKAASLSFDAGVISVLVFGAGTNYALLLVSRYREELTRHDDHRAAIRAAWRTTVGAVVASNLTVVVSLATLVLAVMPAARGLGLAAAVGLLIALASVVLVLPAVLAVCGRRVFWPFVPRPGSRDEAGEGIFARVARWVTRRPAIVVGAGAVVMATMAAGLLGTRIGLTQMEQFSAPNESSAGYATLARHFDPGEAQPNVVVARADRQAAVIAAARGVDGVRSVRPTGTANGWARIQVVGDAEPESARSLATVRQLRDAVHAVAGADALVGGANARAVDVHDGSMRDLRIIAPLIAVVALVALVVLLRAVVAPVLLAVTNLVSAAASIGLGVLLGRHLFDFPGLDVAVPLLAVLFLVALGVDYTIFLVHRARDGVSRWGTQEAMVRAVGSTGVVITSAGVVLAAVFAALGVLPLVVLGQLGLIVGVGVLVDTLVVRTVLVPALFALVGDRLWWPTRIDPTN